jgi:hypothetical protein
MSENSKTQAVELVEPKPVAPTVNGIKPHFDFSDLSWAESIEIGREIAKIGKATDLARTSDDAEEAVRDLEPLVVKFYELLARFVVDIPRTWLVRTAPDDIDYSKPGEVAKWLRRDKSQALITALTLGVNGSEDPNA